MLMSWMMWVIAFLLQSEYNELLGFYLPMQIIVNEELKLTMLWMLFFFFSNIVCFAIQIFVQMNKIWIVGGSCN